MKKSLRAFSLVELSIVILIIGILIAGITQSSRLVSQAKISNAKTLTNSSPVPSVKNLVLWVETTLDESFKDTQASDGSKVDAWYDLNPQALTKAPFAQGTAANQPTYRLDSSNVARNINGLPVLSFAETPVQSFMTSANFANLSTGQSTMFLVLRLPSTLAAQTVLSKRSNDGADTNIAFNTIATNTSGWQFCDSAATTATADCTTAYSGTLATNVAASQYYVLSTTYAAGQALDTTLGVIQTTKGFYLFQDGKNQFSAATTSNSQESTTNALYVGATKTAAGQTGYFGGAIGEIIIYDRVLKQEERRSIETYLGKKWGKTMSVADSF